MYQPTQPIANKFGAGMDKFATSTGSIELWESVHL